VPVRVRVRFVGEAVSALTTPVALVVFNRPSTTARVLAAIRKARPPQLFVIGDGARDRPERARVERVREIVEESVDWGCEVFTDYSDVNLGPITRVASGLDWVFGTVDRAIILEDDTVPDPSFFRFCQELLEYYEDDPRVMHIAGSNLHWGKQFDDASYWFSKYVIPPWGWASWRRAWAHYDVDLEGLPQFKKERGVASIFKYRVEQMHRLRQFEAIYEGRGTSWDMQWQYCVAANDGLAVCPRVNLIHNTGHGQEATRTVVTNKRVERNQASEMMFPLIHPADVAVNEKADRHHFYRNVLQRNVSFLVRHYCPASVTKVLRWLYRSCGGSTSVG